jgi:uncharacterized protein involved in exopolysaccharide biosynthesis
LSQLKNALVNAQVHTAELLGSMSEKHPFVVAAREAEERIRRQLNNEIAVAIRGVQVEVDVCSDREHLLDLKTTAARERMTRLAGARAEYASLVASVQNHTKLVEAARKNLADARARQAGANGASVISRIDGVEAGIRPAGPSRKTVTAAGGVGGLMFGFGLIFLFANPSTVTVSPSPTPVVHASQVVSESVLNPVRVASEAFGMFRGMSLKEAIRSVEGRLKK